MRVMYRPAYPPQIRLRLDLRNRRGPSKHRDCWHPYSSTELHETEFEGRLINDEAQSLLSRLTQHYSFNWT